MSEIIKTFQGGSKATLPEIDLSTPDATRETFACVITEYAEGRISENQARTLSYLLSNYLPYWKFLKDIEIEERLEAIEQALEARR